MLYLGIDIGTTHLKTCLLDENLEVMHITIDDNRTYEDIDYGVCYNPLELWNSIEENFKIALYDIDVSQIKAIGITSMAEAGVPIDNKGTPLSPIIPWQNTKGDKYLEKIRNQFGDYDLYKRTGLIYHPKYSLARILALKNEHPALFERMSAWLSVTDWIVYKLSKAISMDETQACRTMIYNINERKWDQDIIKQANLEGKLAPINKMGKSAGTISDELVNQYGFSKDTVIVPAGHDHLCAAIGTGSHKAGHIFNSMGTSEVYLGFSDSPIINKNMYDNCINQGCFTDGKYYWMANLPASGASIEWMRKILSTEGEVKYDLFMKKDKLQEPSPIIYYPYLNGSGTPHTDSNRKATFMGLSSDTSVYQLIKGMYEGIGYESRWIIETLELMGVDVGNIIAAGGGTKNEYLLQTKVNTMNRSISITQLDEATSIGAAIQAAMAYNEGKDNINLVNSLNTKTREKISQVIKPDEKYVEHYKKGFKKYKRLFDSLKCDGEDE